MTNSEKGLLSQLRKETRLISQTCYNPCCKELAIRSHIQQLKGSIHAIATNGKIVQLEDTDRKFYPQPYIFKEKHTKEKGDVLTFWGFCNQCDTKIFEEIEKTHIDFSLYKNQLLYSYRGFLSEHYKQEYNIKWYESIFNCVDLNNSIKSSYLHLDKEFKLSVKLGKQIKILFEKDLFEGTTHFEFINFNLPRIEVCTSTTYTIPFSLSQELIYELEMGKLDNPLISPIFINLIPNKTGLNVILGCLSDTNAKGRLKLSKISALPQKEKIKLISDILIKHVETWFVSLSLYNTWKQRKMDNEILTYIAKYLAPEMKLKHLKFNMFQDIIK
jgi:hypothetical protein